MRNSSRSSRSSAVMTTLAIGATIAWAGGALAEPPLGIQGKVTVTNDASRPVPVTIEGVGASEPALFWIQGFEEEPTGVGTLFLGSQALWSLCVGEVPACEQVQDVVFRVPDDKQFVVEQVSFRTRVLAGSAPPAVTAEILISLEQGFNFSFTVGELDYSNPQFKIFSKGAPMHVTMPPGAAMTVRFDYGSFSPTKVEGKLDISGRFVSLP